MPSQVASDSEFAAARKIADRAMIAGWDRAIVWAAQELGIEQMEVRILLNRAEERNDSLDPSARINELEDWKAEKRDRSENQPRTRGGGPRDPVTARFR